MGQKISLLVLSLGVVALLAQSCDSGSGDGTGSAAAGTSGVSGSNAHAGAAGSSVDNGGAAGAAGEGGMAGSAPRSDSAGAGGMPSSSDAGAGGVGIAETACVTAADCLPVCEKFGWPAASCFGTEQPYCLCKTSDAQPSCTIGTTEGCPKGTQCYGGHACLPYGTAMAGDPCANGDECAVGYRCVQGGTGSDVQYTHCRAECDLQHPLPPGCGTCNGLWCDPAP